MKVVTASCNHYRWVSIRDDGSAASESHLLDTCSTTKRKQVDETLFDVFPAKPQRSNENMQRWLESWQRRLDNARDMFDRANMMATITCEQGALFLNQRFDANPKDIQRLFNLLEEHRSILDKAAVQTLREEGNAFVEKRFFGQAKERMSSWSTPSGR